MKILHVIPHFSWEYGGSVKVVYDISRELSKMGHDVTIYTTDVGMSHRISEEDKILFENDRIEVKYFRSLNNWISNNLKLHLSPEMRSALKNEIKNFDVVHLHECRGLPHVYAWYYAKKYKVPFILQADGSSALFIKNQGLIRTLSKIFFDEFFGHRIIKDAEKLIAISKEDAENYRKITSKDDNISLIYTGLDLETFEKLPKYGNFRKKYGLKGNIILYLGRINKTKGIDFAIQAFYELKDEQKDTIFVIAGPDDGYKDELEKLIEKLNLKDEVKFTGFLSEKDKISAYLDADLFLHTVLHMGGVGLTPLESILCGTPVIVTKECGEVIESAKCGYLVEYDDVDYLKKKIKYLIKNPVKGGEMVERGKKYIFNNLTRAKYVKKIYEVYKSCE